MVTGHLRGLVPALIATVVACASHSSIHARSQGTVRLVSEAEPPFVLDAEHRTAIRPLDGEAADVSAQRFVGITISRIVNPKRRRLIFDVYYRPLAGGDTRLGEFSPFPSDRPGAFIVPTQGVLRREGSVVVALTSPDSITTADSVRVELERISPTSE